MDGYIILVLIAAAGAGLAVLMHFYDRLINLAHLKKTQWVMAFDKKSYEEAIPCADEFGVHETIIRYGVTFRLTDGTYKWLFMTEEEMCAVRLFSVGKLTYRGEHFIRFKEEAPPKEILDKICPDN